MRCPYRAKVTTMLACLMYVLIAFGFTPALGRFLLPFPWLGGDDFDIDL
jgi:hypothetical protein